jgi:hypothetical protein
MYNNWPSLQRVFVVFFHDFFVKEHKWLNSVNFIFGNKKPAIVRWLMLFSGL